VPIPAAQTFCSAIEQTPWLRIEQTVYVNPQNDVGDYLFTKRSKKARCLVDFPYPRTNSGRNDAFKARRTSPSGLRDPLDKMAAQPSAAPI
jgi:hypothetical protein